MTDNTPSIQAQIFEVTIDARDPERLAEFWSLVLNRPSDRTTGDVVSLATDAAGTRLSFSRSANTKTTKNRCTSTSPSPTGTPPLTSLWRTAQQSLPNSAWTVMADPEGNEFCIT